MNFKELDDLIHRGVKEVVLESDILLDNGEEFEYREGIKLDVDDLVIDGGGHTIDACGKTRIFLCCSANTIIKDITLKNGFTEESGGAIFNAKDAELRLKDCNFNNNHALSRGGSVENNRDSKLYVAKCNFSKNSAEDGGAISNMKRCHLILKDCCFENNEAMDHVGLFITGWALWTSAVQILFITNQNTPEQSITI